MVCADMNSMDIYEKLKLEWVDSLNSNLSFSAFLPHGKLYWWTCKQGHEWEASITNRKSFGCPICAGKKIVSGINDLASQYPEVAKEWHPTKNTKVPETTSKKSSKKVWWLGECGHEWEAKPLHRVNGSGCPYCSNHKILPGFNDIVTTHPDLANKWDFTKNEKPIQAFSIGSGYKAWWVCEGGHSYQRIIFDQWRYDAECYYCSGLELLSGFNDLSTTHTDLVKEWHPTKNNALLPHHVMKSNSKKVWWLGECGHEWEAKVISRTFNSTNCPVCSGNLVVAGFNDLKFKNPILASEWHPTKNSKKSSEVTVNSTYKAWWLGKDCGHEWQSLVSNRNSNNAACSICSSKKVLVGFNDLASKNPIMSTEWHPTKNANLTTKDVIATSSKKVWWLCSKGHEWKVSPNSRRNGSNCPVCAANSFSSKGEKMIFDYIKEMFLNAEANVRHVLGNNQELDIWVPDRNVAIEFNGLYWHDEHHKPRYYHYDKWQACKDKGIQLIQVWEDDWNSKPEIVKSMLAHKLGSSSAVKVYARNTEVVNISQPKMNEFLKANHIQGSNDGSIRVALVRKQSELFLAETDSGVLWEEPEILAAMLLKREPGTKNKTLNLLRFATSANVVGGFTKLLKYVERTYDPESIISFSDNTVSDGGLYENNGFVSTLELKPDYMYVANNKRIHKFNYRLKRFRDDPELLWDENLTERELALLNNLPRIWDAGKTRWVKYFNQPVIQD